MNYHKHSCKTAGLLVCLTLLVGCNSSGTVMPIATEVEVSNETQIPTKIGTPLPTYTREDLATSTPGVLSSPTSVPLSQSPGRIAFVSNRDGDYEIFSMEVDGSDLQQITDNDMHEVMPVWSPDGEKLAVTQYAPGDSENYYEASNIFVIDRISRDQTQLTFSPGFIPSFTNLEPKWSPDSSKILFMSTYEGMPDLYMVDADGDNIIRLTEEPSQVDMPSESFPSGKNWSPDGNKIVFFSTRDGDDRDIYIMQSDGSEIRRLTDHEASDTNPTWSPDGKRIAFTSERDDPEIPCFFECNTEIYLISPDGSDLKRLTAHPGQDRDPVWSPDGERVAFISNRDGNWEIYVIDVDGSNLSRITNSPANDWDPVWSPDGQRFAFVSARDGNAEIYVVDLDGNNLKRLTDHPADDLYPAWSPLPMDTSKPTPIPEITSSPSATSKIVPGVSSEEINELLLQANLLFYNAEYKGAIDVCNRILEIDQTNVEAYLLRADVQDNLGDPEAANADYLKVLELGEDSSLVLNNLCWNYAIMEQPEDALSFCKDALYKDYSPEILDSRGLVYALLDEYVYAIADFQNVVNALEDNNDPQSRYLYTTRLGWMEALIAGEDPFTPELLKELREGDHFLNGLDFHTHLMYEGAIKEFSLAIEHNQQLPDAYKFRGFVYNNLNQYEKAVEDLNMAIEMNPDAIELYLYRSWSYARLGENQLALSDLDRVIALDQLQNYQSKVELLKAYLSYPIPVKVDDSEKTPTPLPAAVPILDIAGDLPPVIEDEFGVTMVLVPAGEFTMGIDADTAMEECNKILSSCGLDEFSDAEPPHIVYLDDYYIDLTEVTNSMYDECIGAGVCRGQRDAASYTREDYALNSLYDDYPVIWVPWEYAETYCEWRGARLPTEAEWEKAARGTDERIYPWGNTLDWRKANFCGVDCIVKDYNDTLPVESNPSDISPYGLLDMAGNVAEWVEDYYQDDYYSQSPMENPQGPEVGEYGHVVRGGAWSWSVGNLFTTYRNFTSANSSMSIGFRCVRTP